MKGGTGPELDQSGLALAAGALVVRRDAVLADIAAVELRRGVRRVYWNEKTRFQSLFISITVQLFTAAASSALSSLPK
jgi:hypothetical protein